MFTGFTDAAFEFFMALRFNNNTEFFHANHDWYVNSLRKPLLELSADLGETIRQIDENLERRPEKTVSRLNRDIRFSKDKSPYRDYMWIGFHNTENKHGKVGFYVDISDEGVGFGMGFYEENKPLMNAHRQMLVQHPEVFKKALKDCKTTLKPNANCYKRIAVPQEVPQELGDWYKIRSFAFSGGIKDRDIICSDKLTLLIKEEFIKLIPIYNYFNGLIPIEDTKQ